MRIYDYVLQSNGLRVVYVEKKDSDVIAISLMGKCGSVFEEVAGTAHFLEHLLLDGSQKYKSKKELLSLVVDAGGSSNASTSKDFTEFKVKSIKSEVEKGLELLSQAVFYPTFDEKSINKEKNIIIQEIKRAFANNQRQLFETMVRLSYKDKSMNRMVLGTEESVSTINKDILHTYWKKFYCPNNFTLSVTGNLDKEYLFKLVEKYFGNILKGMVVENKLFEINEVAGIKIINRENATQARLMLAYSSPEYGSVEYYPSLLLSSILGKGMMSRLFQAVREDKQLVYDISSWNWTGLNRGLFYSHCGVEEKNINEVLKIILNEQKKIVDDGVSDKELEMNKKKIRSESFFEYEDSFQLASHYSMLRLSLNNLMTIEDELNKIDSVTSDDIKNIAIKIFNSSPQLAILAKELTEDQIEIKF